MFGGNNPIFLPFHTDEIEYDEIYVNGNINEKFYESRMSFLDEKLKHLPKDLNFIENTAEVRIGPNYGLYQKKYESDEFMAILQHCDRDKDLIKRKEQNNAMNKKSIKMINKFN